MHLPEMIFSQHILNPNGDVVPVFQYMNEMLLSGGILVLTAPRLEEIFLQADLSLDLVCVRWDEPRGLSLSS